MLIMTYCNTGLLNNGCNWLWSNDNNNQQDNNQISHIMNGGVLVDAIKGICSILTNKDMLDKDLSASSDKYGFYDLVDEKLLTVADIISLLGDKICNNTAQPETPIAQIEAPSDNSDCKENEEVEPEAPVETPVQVETPEEPECDKPEAPVETPVETPVQVETPQDNNNKDCNQSIPSVSVEAPSDNNSSKHDDQKGNVQISVDANSSAKAEATATVKIDINHNNGGRRHHSGQSIPSVSSSNGGKHYAPYHWGN